MHDLIIPPEPPQPKRHGPPAKLPVEIVIDRRGSRPVRYGLIAALIGLAGLAATHFYAPDRSKDAKVQKAEAQAPQQVTIPVLDEASKRRIAALQDEVQELRTKLDAVEKRQQAIVFAHRPPAPLRPLSKTKLLPSRRKLRPRRVCPKRVRPKLRAPLGTKTPKST